MDQRTIIGGKLEIARRDLRYRLAQEKCSPQEIAVAQDEVDRLLRLLAALSE